MRRFFTLMAVMALLSLPVMVQAVCTTTISSFPYNEDFEGGLGAWVQDATDDMDWTWQTGATGSTGTGPSGDHTTGSGYYYYTESSSPNYDYHAILHEVCFDTTSLTVPDLRFYYHMYGAAMGTLNVDVSTDGGTSWTNLWTMTGDQGDAWHLAVVDVSSYTSQTIEIRFDGLTGLSYTSDMAIDDIYFGESLGATPTPTVTPTSTPASLGADCSNPIIVNQAAMPYTETGSTNCGLVDTYDATCLGSYDGGEDIMYQVNLASDTGIMVSFDPGATTWTGFLIDDSCPPDPTTCIATYTNTGSGAYASDCIDLTAGTYYIMIDTWPSPDCIPAFDLTIEECVYMTPTPTLTPTPTATFAPFCNDYEYSSSPAIAVPDNGCGSMTYVEDIITVTDVFNVGEVGVEINLTHTYDGDLYISLLAPDGVTEVALVGGVGGTGENFVMTQFRDTYATPITSGTAPFTGQFQPMGTLGDFMFQAAAGNWTLRVCDNAGADTGTLDSWRLCLTETLLQPVTFTQMTPGGTGTGAVYPYIGSSVMAENTTIDLIAAPGLGSDFTEWQVDSSSHAVTEVTTLLMDVDHNAQAIFAPQANLLLDNGGLVTSPGQADSGYHASENQDALGQTTWGYGVTGAYHCADDFIVPPSVSWDITSFTFYAYQTGSGNTSTLTDVYFQIWDGDPSAGGTVIYGDLVTNVMTATDWTGIYRMSANDFTNIDRPVMYATCDVTLSLNPGTYWVDWSIVGSGASGPWQPPVTYHATASTGNAIQNDGTVWAALDNAGGTTLPFVVKGTEAVAPDYIDLTPGVLSGSAVPGGVITQTLTLWNYGSVTEDFDIAVSGETWTTAVTSTNPVTIAPSASATVTVTIDVPGVAIPGATDSCTITATGQTSALTDASTINSTAANALLICDAADNQLGQAYSGQINAYTSTAENTTEVADDFSGLTGDIETLDWWGIEADLSGPAACDKSADFIVTFYTDVAGAPGTVYYTETITTTQVDTGEVDPWVGTPIYKYHAVLTTPVDLASGWVSVVGIDEANSCYFFWSDAGISVNGAIAVQDTGLGFTTISDNVDIAMCINGTTGPTPTPRPIPSTGPAGIGLLLLAVGGLMSLAGIRRRK